MGLPLVRRILKGLPLSASDYDNNLDVLEQAIVNIELTPAPQGIQGLQGLRGLQGLQELQGLQGIQGLQGFTGEQGVQGYIGSQGIQGTTGINRSIRVDSTTTSNTIYVGKAAPGSRESSEVWTITKFQFSTAGVLLTTTPA